jgi:hypothetical protein
VFRPKAVPLYFLVERVYGIKPNAISEANYDKYVAEWKDIQGPDYARRVGGCSLNV